MAMGGETGNLFEDFCLEQRIEHVGGRTLTEGDNAVYLSLTGDRNPLFCDAEFARSMGYRRECINDLLVFHVVFGKSVPDISQNAVANLGYADVRFLRPVYPGDTLRAASEVVGLKENSNGRTGNVYVHTKGTNQHGEVVLQFYRWVMVPKRDSGTALNVRSIPDLPTEVSIDSLGVSVETQGVSALASPNSLIANDYAVGTRIHHGPGMTIEETEHASATRLYQNTARVHFDAHAMKESKVGRRLVYGGHIISLARAMSFNGLENALQILAWNGGIHANPTFAGDTLYAFSEVLARGRMPNREDVEALRLRLVAVKNYDPASGQFGIQVDDKSGGRIAYHPNVVLDLDYYVLMPNVRVPATQSSAPAPSTG